MAPRWDDASNARADEEAERVRQCLKVHGNRFVYQKTLGRGAFGVACLIRHNRHDGSVRYFVVKRALSRKDQRNLQREVDISKVRFPVPVPTPRRRGHGVCFL